MRRAVLRAVLASAAVVPSTLAVAGPAVAADVVTSIGDSAGTLIVGESSITVDVPSGPDAESCKSSVRGVSTLYGAGDTSYRETPYGASYTGLVSGIYHVIVYCYNDSTAGDVDFAGPVVVGNFGAPGVPGPAAPSSGGFFGS
ncbi:hypothetical protein HQ325_02115 [Rhodococcus sp. BP-349]|uniref:hypothetical protein n=1 Tax=unclassified Rhodococcus (in: high G+C Gram-positive bacteria) TaxID=192944 RepID=UPI001C9B7299|nr:MULTISPECIES: hypothetical protein [unclassified Rhodococcus (in: high G+C Gram-positive bacteria)]MBY6537457.1 hypothetical protein [Rhodococcus sp. BP-363]MBY6541794.1 hypothetical protein [Rhodococcus sp. BP-369]MBY6561024.1 hypothetical protein [Rhodococcus sp. BP-370]MBY6575316.1 hypothetical protein [Rhodococcus sp. BP-364]MBY6584617.1 hypothetical protein [Rhodococcus sp. BP-358]